MSFMTRKTITFKHILLLFLCYKLVKKGNNTCSTFRREISTFVLKMHMCEWLYFAWGKTVRCFFRLHNQQRTSLFLYSYLSESFRVDGVVCIAVVGEDISPLLLLPSTVKGNNEPTVVVTSFTALRLRSLKSPSHSTSVRPLLRPQRESSAPPTQDFFFFSWTLSLEKEEAKWFKTRIFFFAVNRKKNWMIPFYE